MRGGNDDCNDRANETECHSDSSCMWHNEDDNNRCIPLPLPPRRSVNFDGDDDSSDDE